MCVPEAHGGLGLGIAFAVPLAHAAGKLRLQFPLIEQVLLAKALAGTAYGEQLASGNKLATMALQGELSHGLVGAARHAQHGDWVLVFDGDEAVLMDLAGVAIAADTSLDPDYPQHWLSVAARPVLARLDAATCKVLWHEARILLSAMVNGAADGALEATVGYMSTRVQFGRPLSANQAVRHALARMKLLQEASAAAIQRVLLTNEYGQARDAQSTLAGSIAHAVWVLEKAIHLHGGMGFIEETGAAQYYRDAKILTIYEGTTAIQANDLVGRKTARDGGQTAKGIAAQIEKTEADLLASGTPAALAVAKRLTAARKALLDVIDFVAGGTKAQPNAVFAGSVPYLMLAGNVVAGWQLARSLLVAQDLLQKGQDEAFMRAKITTAQFYADHILVKAPGLRDSIVEGAASVTELALEAF